LNDNQTETQQSKPTVSTTRRKRMRKKQKKFGLI